MDNTPATREELPEEQQLRLNELEVVIKDNIQGFFKVGYALREIRDNRLYRADHDSFEAYCQDRWDFSGNKAYKQISSIDALENLQSSLPESTTVFPTCEAQVRPLTKLPPKKQVEVWEDVVKEVTETGGRLTSGLVARVVKDSLETKAKKVRKKITERVYKEDRYTMKFKKEFNSFLNVISEEYKKNWKETSRDALLLHLRELLRMVEEQDL